MIRFYSSQLLVHTNITWDGMMQMTIPQLNLLVPALGKEICLKIFQQYPPERKEGTVEDFMAMEQAINALIPH